MDQGAPPEPSSKAASTRDMVGDLIVLVAELAALVEDQRIQQAALVAALAKDVPDLSLGGRSYFEQQASAFEASGRKSDELWQQIEELASAFSRDGNDRS